MSHLIPSRGFRELSRGFWDDPFFRSFLDTPAGGVSAFRVDVKDMNDHYLLEADIPGVESDQLEITADDGVLTIAANMNMEKKESRENYVYNERRIGRFSRSFNLEGIDEENITADYKDGVLRLTLPKEKAEEPRPVRRIAIGAQRDEEG
ncbi:MAG: Hsp20/alpha crystallin family protein [Christensenellales bacterium]|jgi:HSP20 family protein